MLELGPQSKSDLKFTARMRRHQSWYRMNVLKLACGKHHKKKDQELGSMLRDQDGQQGYNFLTEEIHRVAIERLADGDGLIEEKRLMLNMLSSQPMCFNLFGPMVHNLELATKLWSRIFPGEIDHVTCVKFEYSPTPKSEYLNDATAFDAYVEYIDFEGRKCFIGIETKLTEPFSQKMYDGNDYRRWMKIENSPWNKTAWDKVHEMQHNQLWRDHLLAVSLKNHKSSDFHKGIFAVVRHPEDKKCAKIISGYNLLLKNSSDFHDLPINQIINAWKQIPLSDMERSWLTNFSIRYLELNLSESAG